MKNSETTNSDVCPDDWQRHGDKCYKVGDKKSKRDSFNNCQSMDAILAVPENDEQNTFIRTLFKDDDSAWLGLNDSKNEGTFLHDRTKAVLTYVPLDPEWPNTETLNSVVLLQNGLYKMVDKYYQSKHVCQKDATSG